MPSRDLESFVKTKCAEGAHVDARSREEAVTRLAASISRGLADVAEGRVKDGRKVLARLERKYAALAKVR